MLFWQKIQAKWSLFWRHVRLLLSQLFSWRFVAIYLSLGLFLNLLNWALLFLLYRRLGGGLAVLHYNIDFGIDLIGASWKIFIGALMGSIFLLFDFFFLLFLIKNKNFKFFAQLLLSFLLVALFLLLAGTFAIYLINFR